VREAEGKITNCELAAPARLSLGESYTPDRVAAALSLTAGDVVTGTHPPRVASVGLPFLIAELRDRAALERVRVNLGGFEALQAEGGPTGVHVYARAADGFDLRARMFAPLSGVPEDPATGSASCALAGLLAQHRDAPDGDFSWRIAQGVEMGRPSTLVARAGKKNGIVETTWVGGSCVLVSEGVLHVD
jgi:trans-2,3-dihydro-3-hydroxyanthranilate isomerase